MLRLITSLSFILLSIHAFTQNDEKIILAVYDFNYDPSSELIFSDLMPSVKQYVISAFQNSGRFQVLDRTSTDKISEEIRLQRSRDYISNSMVSESKKLGAKYILTGDIDMLTAEKKDHGDVDTYSANVSFLLKIIDIEKNAILASEQIRSKAGGLVGMVRGRTSSPIDAVNGALKNQVKKIEKFIEKNFGKTLVEGQIVEVTESSKGEAKKVLISVESSVVVAKKNKFIVFIPTETTVAGKTKIRERQLGELQVELVEDEEFSLCKVKDGGAEIMAEINAGNTVYVKLKEKGGMVKFVKNKF